MVRSRLLVWMSEKSGRDVRNVIGVVTQHDGLDNSLVVHRNLEMHGYLAGSVVSATRSSGPRRFWGSSTWRVAPTRAFTRYRAE